MPSRAAQAKAALPALWRASESTKLQTQRCSTGDCNWTWPPSSALAPTQGTGLVGRGPPVLALGRAHTVSLGACAAALMALVTSLLTAETRRLRSRTKPAGISSRPSREWSQERPPSAGAAPRATRKTLPREGELQNTPQRLSATARHPTDPPVTLGWDVGVEQGFLEGKRGLGQDSGVTAVGAAGSQRDPACPPTAAPFSGRHVGDAGVTRMKISRPGGPQLPPAMAGLLLPSTGHCPPCTHGCSGQAGRSAGQACDGGSSPAPLPRRGPPTSHSRSPATSPRVPSERASRAAEGVPGAGNGDRARTPGLHATPESRTIHPRPSLHSEMLLQVVTRGGREAEFNHRMGKITPDRGLVRKTSVFLLLLWCHTRVTAGLVHGDTGTHTTDPSGSYSVAPWDRASHQACKRSVNDVKIY